MYEGELISGLSRQVDELTYRSYAHNRRISPAVAPERWGKLFANAEAMERRFQSENAGDDSGDDYQDNCSK